MGMHMREVGTLRWLTTPNWATREEMGTSRIINAKTKGGFPATQGPRRQVDFETEAKQTGTAKCHKYFL